MPIRPVPWPALRRALSRLRARIYRMLLARPHRPPREPVIVFAIPLVGQSRARDWARTCRLLEGTLMSLRRQNYPAIRVYLCCQDRPEGFGADPAHVFVPAPRTIWRTAKGLDKLAKLELLVAAIAARERGFCYVMFLDADDVLHPGLCRHVAADNNGRGYLVEKGHMLDARTGRIAWLGGAGSEPFWRQCGSSALFAVDFRRRLAARYLRSFGGKHLHYAEKAARMGYPLAPVPFRAVLYVYATGENVSKRTTGGAYKQALLEYQALPRAEARAVAREYGLPQYPALVTACPSPAAPPATEPGHGAGAGRALSGPMLIRQQGG